MKKTLTDLRKDIDTADEELIKILEKRFTIVREIGKLKKEKNIPALDKERWNEVLNKLSINAKKHNISEELIKKIYEEIHKTALKIENE